MPGRTFPQIALRCKAKPSRNPEVLFPVSARCVTTTTERYENDYDNIENNFDRRLVRARIPGQDHPAAKLPATVEALAHCSGTALSHHASRAVETLCLSCGPPPRPLRFAPRGLMPKRYFHQPKPAIKTQPCKHNLQIETPKLPLRLPDRANCRRSFKSPKHEGSAAKSASRCRAANPV